MPLPRKREGQLRATLVLEDHFQRTAMSFLRNGGICCSNSEPPFSVTAAGTALLLSLVYYSVSRSQVFRTSREAIKEPKLRVDKTKNEKSMFGL